MLSTAASVSATKMVGPTYLLALSLVLDEWVQVTKRWEVGDDGSKRGLRALHKLHTAQPPRNKEAFLFRVGRLKFWNWNQVAWDSLTPLPSPVEHGGEETSGESQLPPV